MDAAAYDRWYRTPRGAWIGDVEFRLLRALLQPEPGERLLDVGCGTGHFTRRFAVDGDLTGVGIDPDMEALAYARAQRAGDEHYCRGVGERLPFADASFERTISVAALCFVADARRAVAEIVRVTRHRFAIGLLHRHSALWLQKGRGGGAGAYRGAHWHTRREVRALFAGLPVAGLTLRTAVLVPTGGAAARAIERAAAAHVPLGAFLAVAGDVVRPAAGRDRFQSNTS